jgi:hypothetical protein
MRWPSACEDVSPGAGERPLLRDVTKQRSEDRDWEHWSLCESDLYSAIMSCVFKCPINPITNPNPVHSQSRDNTFLRLYVLGCSQWYFKSTNFKTQIMKFHFKDKYNFKSAASLRCRNTYFGYSTTFRRNILCNRLHGRILSQASYKKTQAAISA